MSTAPTENENSPQEADDKPDGTPGPETLPGLANSPETPETGTESEPETFSRAYVEELRAENAKHRTNAKRSDELTQRLVSTYVETTGKLHDPRDLPYSDDLIGDDGMPDREKVTAAVEALIKDRPHLARIRPVGDVGQGTASESSSAGLAAFGDMLRSAAG